MNTFGPVWLVGGVCSARRNLKRSACIKLLRNPWEAPEVPIITEGT